MRRLHLIALETLDKLPRRFKNLNLNTTLDLTKEALNLSETGSLVLRVNKAGIYGLDILSAEKTNLESICYPLSAFQFFLEHCDDSVYDIILSRRDNAFYTSNGQALKVMDSYLVEPKKIKR